MALLAALGIKPDVCHLNEGMRLPVLERALDFMHETAQPFDVALAVTRAGTCLPAHSSGCRFDPSLRSSSSNTFVVTPSRNSGLRFTTCWPLAVRIERLV